MSLDITQCHDLTVPKLSQTRDLDGLQKERTVQGGLAELECLNDRDTEIAFADCLCQSSEYSRIRLTVSAIASRSGRERISESESIAIT